MSETDLIIKFRRFVMSLYNFGLHFFKITIIDIGNILMRIFLT